MHFEHVHRFELLGLFHGLDAVSPQECVAVASVPFAASLAQPLIKRVCIALMALNDALVNLVGEFARNAELSADCSKRHARFAHLVYPFVSLAHPRYSQLLPSRSNT